MNNAQELHKEMRAITSYGHKKIYAHIYKIGDVVENDVKYFGKEKIVNKHRTAMFICPRCNELWRVAISSIANSRTKSCGCVREKKEDL